MNRCFRHALAAFWMLCVAGSAAAQCQAGMPTVPGAGCVPREVMENRGGGYPSPQYAPPLEAPPPPRAQIDFGPPPAAVVEFGAHAISSDNNASLFGGTGSITAGDAQRTVLEFCEERTGRPCRLLGVFKDACQGFAFDQRNTPYRGVHTDPRQAAREAMAACARASGKAQCRLTKLPACAGNDHMGSDFNASKRWAPGEYDAQVQAWTAQAKSGLR